MRSYSPVVPPEIITFFIVPLAVPRKAKVCGPVMAGVIEVIDSLLKSNRERATIGETPLIFNPTLQKL